MLEFTYTLNGLLMIAIPLVLGVALARRFKVEWRLFWIGMLTFAGSQMLHIPFNEYLLLPFIGTLNITSENIQLGGMLLVAVLGGLSAGVFEEVTRYVVYQRWLPEARSWAKGLMFGAGHGGVEAIMLGVLVLYGFFQALTLRGADLPALFSDTPDQVALVQAQLDAYWSTPVYLTLLGALERAAAISLHLSASLMVMQAFTRKSLRWLFAAIGWHALIDFFAVMGQFWMTSQASGDASAAEMTVPILVTEGVIVLFGVASLFIISALRTPEDVPPPPEGSPPQTVPPPALSAQPPPTPEELEDSRYG